MSLDWFTSILPAQFEAQEDNLRAQEVADDAADVD